MALRLICDMCGLRIPAHAHYVLKMEAYADPSVPEVSSEELEECDLAGKMAELIDEMKQVSEEELMDQVHRRFEFRLCQGCHARFLANPLGLPRGQATADN